MLCDSSCNPVYTAKTTLKPSDLSYGDTMNHLYLFLNGESGRSRFGRGNLWKTVTHVYAMEPGSRENYLLVLKDALNS